MNIRPAHIEDAPGIARVHVASWQAAYAGLISSSFLDALSVEQREERWRSLLTITPATSLVFVAENPQGELVGFVNAGAEREGNTSYHGEIYAIYLLKSCQRQGIGRQLFMAAARGLREQGLNSMLLWVLADNNPARAFYEAMGGRYLHSKEIEIGEDRLLEAAYGWKNIQNLLES